MTDDEFLAALEGAALPAGSFNHAAHVRAAYLYLERRGFIEFDYHGLHKELVRHRITRDDVRWAAALIGGLSDHQWRDAFRAGGYTPDLAARFIEILRGRIRDAQRVDLIATR